MKLIRISGESLEELYIENRTQNYVHFSTILDDIVYCNCKNLVDIFLLDNALTFTEKIEPPSYILFLDETCGSCMRNTNTKIGFFVYKARITCNSRISGSQVDCKCFSKLEITAI